MDCPWCGCGWLFICGRCRRAFTFAEVVDLEESWEETGNELIWSCYNRSPEPNEIGEWIEFMKVFLKGITRGQRYVYLDGYVIPTTAEQVSFEGWHARHDLDYVPQVAALDDPSARGEILENRDYWESNRIEQDE